MKLTFWAVMVSFSFAVFLSAPGNACELLSKITTPGYVPNGFNNVVYRTRVMCTGAVVRGYQLDPFSSWEEKTVARLPQADVDKVIAELESLNPGEIAMPLDGGYADGPTTRYVGNNDRGDRVAFFEYSFGQWGKLESFAFADELKQLLDSY